MKWVHHVLIRRIPHRRSGVPLSPYPDRRFHFFGGRFRTGEPVGYSISGCVVCACIGLNSQVPQGEFAPFFYGWAGHYGAGEIDAAEWRANRFRFF